jgi:hypothetical protein
MEWLSNGSRWDVLGLILCGLLLWGVLFALAVYKIGRRREGYTALLVVVGVLVTLGGVAVVSWQAALLALMCFAASGAPMVVGDIVHYTNQREREMRQIREAALRRLDDQA